MNRKYCPLVMHFCSLKSQIIIEKKYKNAYKSEKVTMDLKRIRLLALEVLKTSNNLNPIYMNKLFQKTKFLTHWPSNIEVNISITFKCGAGESKIYLLKYLELFG